MTYIEQAHEKINGKNNIDNKKDYQLGSIFKFRFNFTFFQLFAVQRDCFSNPLGSEARILSWELP